MATSLAQGVANLINGLTGGAGGGVTAAQVQADSNAISAANAAAQQAWAAYQLTLSPALVQAEIEHPFSTPSNAAAYQAWISAAQTSFTQLGNPSLTLKQAQDLDCATYEQATVYKALQVVDQWAKPLGVGNFVYPAGADAWNSNWNNTHQSIVGQVTSAIGGAANGIIQGAAQVVGGQQNFLGQDIGAVGNFVQGAASLAGNNPLQAAADAAEAYPGIVLTAGLANVAIVAGVAGAGTEAVGDITGDQSVANAGQTILNVEGSSIQSAVTDPLSSSEAIGAIVAGAFGQEPIAAALGGAAIGGFIKDGEQDTITGVGASASSGSGALAAAANAQAAAASSGQLPKKSKAPLFIGLGVGAALLVLVAVVL